MIIKSSPRTCPRCGARLTIEQVDHQLTGHERLFCPLHGEMGSLNAPRDRENIEVDPGDDW
ncbi:MAG TPA: hypothetical protein VGK90_07385 [Rhizomicrobium sp.]|jgi:hypothetical protein